jgi:hypothetical protein
MLRDELTQLLKRVACFLLGHTLLRYENALVCIRCGLVRELS